MSLGTQGQVASTVQVQVVYEEEEKASSHPSYPPGFSGYVIPQEKEQVGRKDSWQHHHSKTWLFRYFSRADAQVRLYEEKV